jgi:hypothetical protein
MVGLPQWQVNGSLCRFPDLPDVLYNPIPCEAWSEPAFSCFFCCQRLSARHRSCPSHRSRLPKASRRPISP